MNNIQLDIIKRRQMNAEELAAVHELERTCSLHEGLQFKLNWSMLYDRNTGEYNDFLCYGRNGQLLGYLAMYGFGEPRIEISGMVHPSHRRIQIFSKLVEQAAAECRPREIQDLLFICERKSESGMAFIKNAGAVLDHSEYKMELPGDMKPIDVKSPVILRKVTASDMSTIIRLSRICFNMSEQDAETYCGSNVLAADEIYIAELDGINIGMIRLEKEKEDLFIYGFGIEPEYRGKGYGRATLGKTVNLALSQKPEHVVLEVDCVNDTALSLYRSCGFKTTATYDYYRLPVQGASGTHAAME